MAYMSQERKKLIHEVLKTAVKSFNVKWSLAVQHHSIIVLTIKSGDIDFFSNYKETVSANAFHDAEMLANTIKNNNMEVNEYFFRRNFTGKAAEFLEAAIAALNIGNHDKSDSQSDYFDVGWYVKVSLGKWDSPYQYISGTVEEK